MLFKVRSDWNSSTDIADMNLETRSPCEANLDYLPERLHCVPVQECELHPWLRYFQIIYLIPCKTAWVVSFHSRTFCCRNYISHFLSSDLFNFSRQYTPVYLPMLGLQDFASNNYHEVEFDF